MFLIGNSWERINNTGNLPIEFGPVHIYNHNFNLFYGLFRWMWELRQRFASAPCHICSTVKSLYNSWCSAHGRLWTTLSRMERAGQSGDASARFDCRPGQRLSWQSFRDVHQSLQTNTTPSFHKLSYHSLLTSPSDTSRMTRSEALIVIIIWVLHRGTRQSSTYLESCRTVAMQRPRDGRIYKSCF